MEQMTEQQWKEKLSPEQYDVLRRGGTERAFTGEYWDNHEKGTFLCAGCGAKLFSSDDKYDSGTGWPSFSCPAPGAELDEETDRTWGMVRTEVKCANCGGHLGHVFGDGPRPTGLRYCMNSAALKLERADESPSS
jgi:peptide-methionine (R)-S-oxide reductase